MLPYTEDDVNTLYGLLGRALWHLQHLENIVASFTAFKILQAKRDKGKKITEEFMKTTIANQQKGTLAPIIGAAKQHGSIRGGAPETTSLGYLSWQDKKGNLLPGNPRRFSMGLRSTHLYLS